MRKALLLVAAFVAASGCGTTENIEAQAPASQGQQQTAWAQIGMPQQAKGGDDITGPYEVVPNWPENVCGQGYQGGSVGGVFAETPDRVFVFQRGCLPAIDHGNDIVPERNASGYDLSQQAAERHPRWDHVLLIYNRDGKLVESWEQHNKLFVRPHRVKINPYDPQKHIWIIDDGAHSIYKFTNDGKKLVMTLGEFRKPASNQTQFGRPTDVAWLPNGDFFVSDGYVNTRVVKFNADGKYLLEWGQKGEAGKETRPSYFNTVHGVVVDAQNRVYVADRANRRVQVFDENGKYLSEWYTRFPYYIYMSQDQHLWVGDGQTNKILKYDLTGKLLYSWGTFGTFPGGFWGPHQFSVDSDNNLYIADVHVGRVQKFRPKPGVNPGLLVGQRFTGRSTS
jgi:sugar lactone lactonase YvrE